MARGEEGGASPRLRVEPLLPLAGDRRLAVLVAEEASRHYPESWVRRSNELGRLRVTSCFPVEGSVFGLSCSVAVGCVGLMQGFAAWFAAGSGLVLGLAVGFWFAWWLGCSAAGSYARLGGGLLAVGRGDGGSELKGAIVHELGHRMQHAVAGLVEEERVFLEGKMRRPARVLARPLAFSARFVREIAILLRVKEREAHGLFHYYAAQDPMNGRDYEVFAMGHEAAKYGARDPSTRRFDPDMRPLPDHEAFVRRVLREL